MSARWMLVGYSLLLSVIVGCGGDVAAKVMDLQPVTGTVKMDGQPFPGASVAFMPRGTTEGQVAVSVTDAEGKFEMTYPDGGKGVPIGEYKVFVSKLLTPEGQPIPEGKTAADVMAKDVVHPRYKSLDDMVNVVMIPSGGKADIVIELKSK